MVGVAATCYGYQRIYLALMVELLLQEYDYGQIGQV